MVVREAYSVFSDESALKDQFFAYGGIFVPTSNIDAAEGTLEEFAQRVGFGERSLSWKNCSKGEVDRYVAFAEKLWELNEMARVEFRSLVIDTHRHPLKDLRFGCATEEDGFYKFYHFFITGSIQTVAPAASEVSVLVASTTDSYPYRTEILSSTIGGALRRRLGPSFQVKELTRVDPRASRLHQLADVLVGAVTYRWNEEKRTPTKSPICRRLEELTGRSLAIDFRPEVRPFNVWVFVPKGGKRWVSGSHGTV